MDKQFTHTRLKHFVDKKGGQTVHPHSFEFANAPLEFYLCFSSLKSFPVEQRRLLTIVVSPLFLRQDILCIADREGERVVCVGAGLEHPQLSGAQFTDIPHLGRTFGIGLRFY